MTVLTAAAWRRAGVTRYEARWIGNVAAPDALVTPVWRTNMHDKRVHSRPVHWHAMARGRSLGRFASMMDASRACQAVIETGIEVSP